MDEPLSNLDAKLRNQMRSELIKLRQRINITFVYVTHDQTEAMTLGDRIVVMNSGVVQQIGSPQGVFNRPANMFVAGFIGMPQMNFFDARIDKKNNKYYVDVNGKQLALNEVMSDKLKAKDTQPQDIILGIRPEHISITTLDTDALKATVDVTEMMGSEIHIHVNALGTNAVIRTPVIQLSLEYNQDIKYGTEIAFKLSVPMAHLFSKEDESNLML